MENRASKGFYIRIIKALRGNMAAAEQPLLGLELRQKVAIDMDDTLALLKEAWLPVYNLANGTSFTIEAFKSWSVWDLPATFEQFMNLYHDLWAKDWKSIQPSIFHGTLQTLAERHDVDIVSNRPQWHEPYVKSWMNHYFPDIKVNIVLTESSEKKAQMGYNVMFDDGNPLAKTLATNGNKRTTLYFIDKPWNRNDRYELESPNIIRVKSLAEGIALFVRKDQVVTAPTAVPAPRPRVRATAKA
jgi:5'(3')-deoxyribonucleotidase